jgi:PKD repeat protein
MRGPTSVEQLLAVVAGALVLGLAVVAPPAGAAVDDRDFTAVHRLTVGLYAVAYDDQDNVIGTFDPPPPLFIPPDPGRPPRWTNTTVLDLPTLQNVPPFRGAAGELSSASGLRRTWWRGPFRDANGVGALPQDGSVAMCFKDERAGWDLGDDNEIRVTTRIGLFRGSPLCDTGDLKGQVDMSVTAPPTGVRACGQQASLEDHGDVVTARLCLTNERLDPRPAAHPTRGGDRGPAPFWVNLDASSSVVPDGVASWHWEFGDGISSVQGPTVSHRYDEPGTYPVTLRITDNVGRTRSAVVLSVIAQVPQTDPVARFTGTRSLLSGDVAQFDAAASANGDGLGGTIRAYVWDYGDGTPATRIWAPEATASHRYTAAGGYTVTLTVHTAAGRSATATMPVGVLAAQRTGTPAELQLPGGGR